MYAMRDVRVASFKDRTQLSELFRRDITSLVSISGYYELSENFDWSAYAEQKLTDHHGCILVSERERALTGFIYARVLEYPGRVESKAIFRGFRKKHPSPLLCPIKPLKWGVIEQCYVLPDLRRQGIGSRLVQEALNWFKSRGINRVELSFISNNSEAEKFWRDRGFDDFRSQLHRNI